MESEFLSKKITRYSFVETSDGRTRAFAKSQLQRGILRTRLGGCFVFMSLFSVKTSKPSVMPGQALEEYEMTKRLEEEEVEYAVSSCPDGVDRNGQVRSMQM